MALPPPVLEPLLKWANTHTRGHDHIHPIEDYDETIADGLAFCALIYAYFPEKIPLHELKAETTEDKIRNFNLAFDVAKEMMGAERYLDGEDMVEVRDKKSIMVWMSEVWNCVKEKGLVPKFQASAAWNAAYEQREQERRMEELKARALARMQGNAAPSKPQSTPGKIKGRWNPMGKRDDSDEESTPAKSPVPREEEKKPEPAPAPAPAPAPQPVVEEKPATPAPAPEPTPSAASAPAPAPASTPAPTPAPATSSFVPSGDGIKYEITGRSARGGTAGQSCLFTVKLKLDEKPPAYSTSSDLTVYVEGPSQPTVKVSGSAGWAYAISFTPAVEGQYWFDFVFKGTRWTNQPFMMPIEKNKKVPDYPYQGIKRKAAGA